ncbi:hypothetical protein [Bacteriovorax sp. Seq25_V]|uniref:hypothetical protein n=1 Tax=Bacteriovorax sp. Seq25_V TaxID=1201288 RepID=UPI000389E007|nr:hypothetical protein [Bacteriovorax sp. Seq25_V]EQC44717.1 hypothetical protein M900_0306 [Bacteriovorax sp. Seq25_V]
MNYLYLDTTNNLTIGLLDSNYEWVEKLFIETKRTSEIIHGEIHALLTKHGLSVSDIAAYFTISGPGSYTGMRVSEGINQILELEGKKIYSFPSHLFCELLCVEWDYWFYPAFKSETYVRTPVGDEKLVSAQEFLEDYVGANSRLVTFGQGTKGIENAFDSVALLEKSCSKVFKFVVEADMRQKPFYFRPVEVEFSKSSK